MTEKQAEQIRIMRKTSANVLYDKLIIIAKNSKEVKEIYPSLLLEIREHRNNYYEIIDNNGGFKKETKEEKSK